MNPIFNALGGGMMPMLQQFKQNPLWMLRQFGFNVPANMNNPNEIIQHLMNSGQLSQEQYNQARQMAQTFGIK